LASIELHSSTLGLVLRRPDPYPPISILQCFQVIIWELGVLEGNVAKFSNFTIPPDILIIYCDLLLTIFSINQIKKANKTNEL